MSEKIVKNRKTSPMWHYFTLVDRNKARCDICDRRVSYKTSISNLKRHLERVHKGYETEPIPKKDPVLQLDEESDQDEEASSGQPEGTTQPADAVKKFQNGFKATPPPKRKVSDRVHLSREVATPQKLVELAKPEIPMEEFEAIGVNIMKKLRRMDPVQALFAESIMNVVLRRGLLNTLRPETDICDNQCGRMMPLIVAANTEAIGDNGKYSSDQKPI